MPVQQPPITGDPQQDSFNQQVADAINTMPLGTGSGPTTIIQAGGRAAGATQTGADGFNHATLYLFQRTGLNADNGLTPPNRIQTDLQYHYANGTLRARDIAGNFVVESPWDGWTDFIPERDPLLKDDYVWFQSININDRRNVEFIDSNNWSQVGLYTAPGLGALRILHSYEEVVESDQLSFATTINKIFLGELDVTRQIPDAQICWLLANDDGTIPTDGLTEAEMRNRFLNGETDPDVPELTTAQMEFFNRNFFFSDVSQMWEIIHTGYETTFTQAELFSSTNDNPDAGGDFTQTSREIEPRIGIDNVVYI